MLALAKTGPSLIVVRLEIHHYNGVLVTDLALRYNKKGDETMADG